MTTRVYDIKFLTANFLGAVIAALRLNELGIPHFFISKVQLAVMDGLKYLLKW